MWGYVEIWYSFNTFKSSQIFFFKVLFTSRVFEGIGGDYFVSRYIPGRLFTRPGFEGLSPQIPSILHIFG
jgi:hypothetical protein